MRSRVSGSRLRWSQSQWVRSQWAQSQWAQSRAYRAGQHIDCVEYVAEGVVQRRRRPSYDIRLAPVADHAGRRQPLMAALGFACRLRDAEAQLTPAIAGGAGRDDLDQSRQQTLDQLLQEVGQPDRLFPQPPNVGTFEYVKR